MQIIRQTEEELARCHQKGLVHGACHTYVGQEAIASGVCAHLGPADSVFSTHRGHGHALAKGMPPRELMAELFGRITGCSRGRGGSMHLFSPEIGMMGTSGIVGPCILQACGGGYSSKILKNQTVGVAFFGDGAVNNGAFHEGLNMASIWKLPVLFICENNQYATEVPFAYSSGNPSVGNRGTAYGMPGFELDGNDVEKISEVASAAIGRARRGEGPTLIECKTYRTRPHSEGMGDFTYRTREEVEQWKQRCPIQRLRAAHPELATEFDVIDAEVKTLVTESRAFAESSPVPESSIATTHVYSNKAPATARVSAAPVQTTRQVSYSQATVRHTDLRKRFRRPRWGRRHDGDSPGHRFHVRRLHPGFYRRDHQSDCQDAVHVQWSPEDASVAAWLHRNWTFRRNASLRKLLCVVWSGPRTPCGRSFQCV
jgi:2-oxoisovalerate dehydrogenase E1 component